MKACPSCTANQSESSKFCSECGAALSQELEATVTVDAKTGPAESQASSSWSDASLHGRFVPGSKVADRYRIVSLVGKGGMGEVYRADDLKLGHTVALKFLPKGLSKDARRLELFHSEVRLTRQISHPNVCRVYDIGEADGQHFLSMEYVDGEDLSALIRRIGRVSPDKAIEIAQQLCAGLAAAHDQGVLHRDLKPPNIMLDGRGQVRIMDFGLARLVAESPSRGEIVGTPAYMAPEQLAEGQTTIQSDLFSLGLILAEMFTGRALHRGMPLQEIRSRHEQSSVIDPSTLPEEIDPAVESVILRCLERDAHLRPQSARRVSAALPGGDPLAAAIAAGETPSPEMVAAAGGTGVTPIPIALACLAIFFATTLIAPLLRPPRLEEIVPLKAPPTELSVRAKDIASQLGYDVDSRRKFWGFAANEPYLKQIKSSSSEPARWNVLSQTRPPGLVFWQRWSMQTLESTDIHKPFVEVDDPPLTDPGNLTIRLDPEGRLRQLDAIPLQTEKEGSVAADASAVEPDWSDLFDLAGLEFDAFETTTLESPLPVYCEQSVAWSGEYPGEAAGSITLHAGVIDGKFVHFEIIDSPPRDADEQGEIVYVIVECLIWFIAILLAWRHLRSGRGDRKGAFRLCMLVLVAWLLLYAIQSAHLISGDFVGLLASLSAKNALGHALIHASQTWLGYIAVEPYLRRLWPQLLVTWTRLLDGRFRDPLLARDILRGCAFGGSLVLGRAVWLALPEWLGWPMDEPAHFVAILQGDLRPAVAPLLGGIVGTISVSVILIVLLLGCRIVFRQEKLAIVMTILLMAAVIWMANPSTNAAVGQVIVVCCYMMILLRFGYLVFATTSYIFVILSFHAISYQFDHWQQPSAWITYCVLAALAVCACVSSLGGAKLFKGLDLA